jgi:hypothetical protein
MLLRTFTTLRETTVDFAAPAGSSLPSAPKGVLAHVKLFGRTAAWPAMERAIETDTLWIQL